MHHPLNKEINTFIPIKNMKHIILSTLLFLSALTVNAENYPYRSDVLWVTVPNHTDWIYKTGEQATVNVEFYKYGIPRDGVDVSYELSGDMMPADAKGTVHLKNGKAIIPMGTMQKPGFRDCRLTAVVDGKTYKHHVKVGFSPEQLRPYTQLPADFNEFWKNAKSEASRYPLTYTQKHIEKYSTDKVDCQLIKLHLNTAGQCVYGYLFTPKAKGTYPVVFCPPGAGIKEIKNPLAHKYYAEDGFIRFEIEIHGLNPEMDPDAFQEISRAFNGAENGYLMNGLDNRDNYYMKRVYLSCVRSIDFLTSLPAWDGKNVITQGGSQGGALAIITAGLDKRVTACVANHPALADMAGFKESRADGYPHYSKARAMDTPEKIKTMAYYDVVNFAKQITAPTLMTWGYNDDVCPPTTSYIVYNALTCIKDALITPVNEHWTSEDTERDHLVWIKKYLK